MSETLKPCYFCGSLYCGPLRCRFADTNSSRPLDLGLAPMVCKNHPERAAVDPVALRRCQECKEAALDAYVNQKPPLWPNYDESRDTDIGGRNIRTAEATHRMLSNIAKEKPE